MKFSRLTGVLAVAGVLLASSAFAQEVSVKFEPGVAVPLAAPQSYRYNTGAAGDIKLLVGLGSYLAVGPSASVLGLTHGNHTSAVADAVGVGGSLVAHRPHNYALNTDTGWKAASPWIDTDLQYLRTQDENRTGLSFGAGVSVPTSNLRDLWVGPFVRYQELMQDRGGNDGHVLIAGLSFEMGANQKPAPVPVEPTPCPPVVETPSNVQPPIQPWHPPVVEAAPLEIKQKVQFKFDSSALQANQNETLSEVVKTLVANPGYSATVEGHASSEGQVHHNEVLSLQRAASVVNYLISQGISGNRLSAVGFGSTKPIADNNTNAGRKANRRVDFVVFITVNKNK